MSDLIFGHTWEEIQAIQQGTFCGRPVIGGQIAREVTEQDRRLLAEFGKDGLEQRQYFGTLDRLKAHGII